MNVQYPRPFENVFFVPLDSSCAPRPKIKLLKVCLQIAKYNKTSFTIKFDTPHDLYASPLPLEATL